MSKLKESSDSELESKVENAVGYGYESDSEAKLTDDSEQSSEEEDEEPAKEDNNKDNGGEDDDDMFASDSEKDVNKKKSSKTFDLKQFEQETETSGYQISRSDQDSDNEENDVQIEEFSIRKEAVSGIFDKEGHPSKNESDEEEEPWMEGIEKNDIKRAREAKERQNKRDVKSKQVLPRESLIETLVMQLEAAETAYDALHRLRPPKKRKQNPTNLLGDEERKNKVYLITEACETLANTYFVSQIYELSREQLMRAYKQISGKDLGARGTKRSASESETEEHEKIIDETIQSGDDQKIWMFRWIGEKEINGPYSTYEMRYWKDNYFENNVEVRKNDTGEFTHISEITFHA